MTNTTPEGASEKTIDAVDTTEGETASNHESQVTTALPQHQDLRDDQLARLKMWFGIIREAITIFALIAVPILVARIGADTDDDLSQRSIRAEYVALAIDVINNEASDPYIRDWAVDLFDQNSPIKIPPNIVQSLKDGNTLLPEGLVAFAPYTVQEGDTLDSIRQRFITTTSLMARHGISEESMVPGAVLFVPIVVPLTACGPLSLYIVQDNDTYAELAKRFAMPEEMLRRINNAEADEQLYSKVFICVPRL